MEFDAIVVKESPGLCRCCLSEGCYKDMGTEYAWMNETEVYADMLLECFDISISQINDGPNGPNRLICEVCITRLRDACYFKKQVLDTEKKFVDMVGRGDFRPKVLYQSNMKTETCEAVVVSLGADDGEVEYLDDEMDYEPADTLKEEGQDPEPTVSADPLPIRGKRGRPKKSPTKPEKKKVKVETKAKSSKALVKGTGLVDSPMKINTMTESDRRRALRQNVLQVLLRSNVMPFRWLRSSFRCFYCYEVFEEPHSLKEHQSVHTSEDTKLKSIKNFWERIVYVDVSNISCKLCPENIYDIYHLVDHLIESHGMPFDKDLGLGMSPFKLNELSVQCVDCDQEFGSFGQLLIHTDKKHNGLSSILCEICGQHFHNTQRLKEHSNKEHGTKSICQLCGETFSISRMRTHMQNAHNKQYKCFVCTDLFETHYKRTYHMMTVHKSREQVKCQFCAKSFVFRSAMLRHLRETHFQEKNVLCKVCGYRAFTESRMQRHMTKHSSEKTIKCVACDKVFKTKKTMKQHYENIHQKEDASDMSSEEASE
ncbi:unnamed protein product [Diatraea saccharalis]|uniref:Uncharacterized protein n=1 Tax=Diatraea saccharalis TaxID=40085 RepID=A0A9N9R447_9NEOP|nr:unnamed protein product [Diatraea saccharalis]